MCTCMCVVCAHVCAKDERGIMSVLLHLSPSYSQDTGSLTEPAARLAATAHMAGAQGQATRPSFYTGGCRGLKYSSPLSHLPRPKISF